jgi:hypothetical protein
MIKTACVKRAFFVFAVVAVLAALHFTSVVFKMPNMFDNEPSAGAFGGIRLHYLDVLNFDFSRGISSSGGTSHILDNFLKSASSGTHGLLDFAHWYVYSGLYDMFGIPVNEFWMIMAQAIVMFTGVLIMSFLIYKVYDSEIIALFFLVMSSTLFVHHSINFYIIPANTFYEGLLLLALYYYDWKRPSSRFRLFLLFMLLVNSASGNVIKLPLYAYFAWSAAYKRDGYGIVRSCGEYLVKRAANLMVILPVGFAVAAHLYVYKRIGDSNLGLLGWISQKVGIGAPMVSRFAAFGNTLSSMIFNKTWEWWVFIVVAVFYVLTVTRGRRKAPLLLFPFLYYAYIINFEPNSALLPLLILMSIGSAQMFFMARGIDRQGVLKPLCIAFCMVFIGYMIAVPIISDIYSMKAARNRTPNYLKAAGYFLREHMAADDKIASLIDEKQNILNEYYYGKNFFKSPVYGKYIYDMRNITEPFSPSNPVERGEIPGTFAFYVISPARYASDANYRAFVDKEIRLHSLEKVADVADGKTVYLWVYSSRKLGYERVEVPEADRLFDGKYANLKNLFCNRHVGVASTWGFY